MLPGGGQFGVYAVDPNDPNRIIAAALTRDTPRMVMTTDGGATWSDLPELDSLMTGGGRFRYRAARGPSRFTGFDPYPQPTLLAFDPENPDVIVAGAANAGVFMSIDSGVTWRLLTDPINPGGSGTPHIPRPRYAFFDHLDGGRLRLFLGTMGRGQWRIELEGVPKAERHTLTSSVLFDSGRATIKTAAEPELMAIAEGIRARSAPLVYVDGHTDSVGSEASNQLLSERRADAVRTWLVTRGGVDGSIVQARGFSELRPVATNDTAAGRAANRRVEITVISNAVAAGARH
jgi:flagellar motor protein MotB